MTLKCHGVLSTHEKALVSVSGGADSDVMLDLCERVRAETGCNVAYVWFDTGMEYRATKDHIAYLEGRYGIEIRRERAERTIPVTVMEFGQPFISKYISDMCEKLQCMGFEWEDEPYEVLVERYHGTHTTALKWWSNRWTKTEEPGWYDIGRTKWLREFMVKHPPTFSISAKCCKYAKKLASKRVEEELGPDVLLVGVRRAEGGVRASHKTCFDHGHGIDTYRPLFWLTNADRDAYGKLFGIRHSACYRVWGFTRTGCAGCPYGRDRARELGVIERFEPNMARACRNVFRDSYEYTRQFHEFREDMRLRGSGQMRLSLE